VTLQRIDATGERVIRNATPLPIYLTVTLRPWELCCIEQEPVAE
jgi:hypothetical protein